MTDLPLTEIENDILAALHSDTNYVWTIRRVSEAVETADHLSRSTLQELTNKGLAVLSPAFDDDRGTLQGSGYVISEKGLSYLRRESVS